MTDQHGPQPPHGTDPTRWPPEGAPSAAWPPPGPQRSSVHHPADARRLPAGPSWTPPPPPPPNRRRGLSITGLVLGIVSFLVVGTSAGLALLYAGAVTAFGAPGHVPVSGMHAMYTMALPVGAPLAAGALLFSIIGRIRDDTKRTATAAIVISALVVVLLLLGLPLLNVEPCYTNSCP